MTTKELQEMTMGDVVDSDLFHRELKVLMDGAKMAYEKAQRRTPYHRLKEIGAWDLELLCELYKSIFAKQSLLPKILRDFINQLGKVAYIKTYQQLKAKCDDSDKGQ